MVDDAVRRRKGFDPRFDADDSKRKAQRDCRGLPSGSEMGERALLLFQVATQESADAANLFAQPRDQGDETGRR